MKLITKAEGLREVPERWNKQYGPRYKGTDKDEIYKKLCSIIGSGRYTERQINEAIGNDSWTRLTCNECRENVHAYVHLGEEPDYESTTFFICLGCLKKAVALFGVRVEGPK